MVSLGMSFGHTAVRLLPSPGSDEGMKQSEMNEPDQKAKFPANLSYFFPEKLGKSSLLSERVRNNEGIKK